MWCLDGQQRVTTTVLLVAAARDALLRLRRSAPANSDDKLDDELCAAAVRELEQVLFTDVDAAHAFAANDDWRLSIRVGQRVPFCRVVPSFVDRKPFFELLLAGLSSAPDTLSPVTHESLQRASKAYMDEQFAVMARDRPRTEAMHAVMQHAASALRMQHMLVELQTDANLAQVYQWLQEKTLLSAGALLFNPSPGRDMHACDLVRNMILAPFMDDSLDAQEHLMRSRWIQPIELPCDGRPERIDKVIAAVVFGREFAESQTEQTLKQTARMPIFASQDLSGLLLYARVVSLWEHLEALLVEPADQDEGDDDDVHAQLVVNQRQRAVANALLDQFAEEGAKVDFQ
eukprot:TRINITY_DN248_c0_g1_i3.p1 TRINITY_DN248_c0_g1~~TRINITY_DN248_c0_g1_i3.p1  ORF type:complete len:345 (-),score=162.31 TRINITY_DN248_c0_g1_i3:35-1069(-)